MRIFSLTLLVAAPAGGVPLSVDLLSPGDPGFAGLPANVRCVDVFVDVNDSDVWTAAGLQAYVADLGPDGPSGDGRVVYFDDDPNTPGIQPGLLNPGFARRYSTSVSRPRDRDAINRFEDAGAEIAGGFSPSEPLPTMLPDEVNVAWYRWPPATWTSPTVDGYIARVALDISDVTAAGIDLGDYSNWDAGPIASAPDGATFVLRSEQGPGDYPAGTIVASLDDWWQIYPQLDWGVWYVPEPGTFLSLALVCAGRRRMRI